MVNKKRIYELTEQNTLTDNDVSVVDLSGNTSAKKYKLSTLFNYIKTKLGYGTLTAFNKLYVKSDETGFELKGRVSDYTPVALTELDDLYVELSEVVNDEITANKMISLKGAVGNVMSNVDADTPASTDKLIYFDVINEQVKSVEVGSMGGGSNIATNDLAFTQNSTTDFAGYKGTFDNAELKIISDADNSSDVPLEVTQANGTTSIFKVLGDGQVSGKYFKSQARVGTGGLDIDTAGATPLFNMLALSGTYSQGRIAGSNGLEFYSQGSVDAGLCAMSIDSGKFGLRAFSVSSLPSVTNNTAGVNGVILVTDATPRPTICYSNGANWIDIQTGVAVV